MMMMIMVLVMIMVFGGKLYTLYARSHRSKGIYTLSQPDPVAGPSAEDIACERVKVYSMTEAYIIDLPAPRQPKLLLTQPNPLDGLVHAQCYPPRVLCDRTMNECFLFCFDQERRGILWLKLRRTFVSTRFAADSSFIGGQHKPCSDTLQIMYTKRIRWSAYIELECNLSQTLR